MITLRKENRIVQVSDNELDKYLGKGYTKVEVERPAPPKPQPKVEVEKPQTFEPAFKTTDSKQTRAKRNRK